VSKAALISLFVSVVGFAVLSVTPVTAFAGTSKGVQSSPVDFSLMTFYTILAVSLVGLVLTLLELYFYRQGFRTLSLHDPRFSTPSTSVLVLLVSLVIVAGGAMWALYLLYQAVQCSGVGHSLTLSCIEAGGILNVLGLVAIAGISALVGYLGLLLGIWRMGNRYHDGLFKAGAILLIIPLLNFVGLILIIVAARSARAKLGPGSSASSFG
jgi:hypothetical protein